jgi:hypothetical protein
MISRPIAIATLCAACAAGAASQSNTLAGQWSYDPAQSKNVGMMATMKIHTIIVQSPSELTVDDYSEFNGQKDKQHTVYDLSGKAARNTPIMGGTAATRSRWEDARLITEWESPGSIAGTKVKRTEMRYVSPDGGTMYVESSRPGQDPMVMVFTRDR